MALLKHILVISLLCAGPASLTVAADVTLSVARSQPPADIGERLAGVIRTADRIVVHGHDADTTTSTTVTDLAWVGRLSWALGIAKYIPHELCLCMPTTRVVIGKDNKQVAELAFHHGEARGSLGDVAFCTDEATSKAIRKLLREVPAPKS